MSRPRHSDSRRHAPLFAAGLVFATLTGALRPAPVLAFEPSGAALERMVPEDAFIFASFEGLGALEQALPQLALYKLYAEPETQAFLEDVKELAQQKISELEGGDGIPIRDIRSLLTGRISVAVTDLTLIDPPGVRRGDGPPFIPFPGILLSVDAGSNRKLLEGYMQQLFSQAGEEIVHGSYEYAGRTIKTISPAGSRFMAIGYTWLDDTLLVGLNKYCMKDAFDLAAGKGRSLAQTESFQRASSKVPGQNLVSLFVNIDAVTSRIAPMLPLDLFDWAEFFGIANINALSLAVKADGADSREVLYVDAPGAKNGLLKVFAPGPSRMKALAFAPKESNVFLTCQLDVASAYQEIRRLAAAVEPRAVQEMDRAVAQASQEAGFHVLDDFIASLDGEISLFSWVPMGGALIPNVALVIGLRDEQKFENCLKTALQRAAGHVEFNSLPFEGSEIHYCRIGQVPVTPSYFFAGDAFIVATAPNIIKDLVQRRKNQDETLADNPDFTAARKSMVPGSSMFEYVDFRPMISMGYNLAAMALPGLAAQQNIPIDFALMPTTGTLIKHFTPATCSYVADKDGLLLESRSPIGLGVALCALGSSTRLLDDVRIGPDLFRRLDGHQGVNGGGRRTGRADMARPAPAPAEDPYQAGLRLFQGQQYEEALRCFERGLQQSPNHPDMVFYNAFSNHALGHYEPAVAGFKKAAALGRTPAVCEYNVACGLSRLGRIDEAFDSLQKALDSGFSNDDLLFNDSDLDNLRTDPRFKKILASRPH